MTVGDVEGVKDCLTTAEIRSVVFTTYSIYTFVTIIKNCSWLSEILASLRSDAYGMFCLLNSVMGIERDFIFFYCVSVQQSEFLNHDYPNEYIQR